MQWNKKWVIFWLAALALLFYGNDSLLITDSVESNYALTAKEMVISGDWISPQIYGHYWYDKPVLFYWLTALGFKLFGFTEFAARFFPAVFGLLGLALVCWGGKKLYNEQAGFISGLVLLSSVEFFLISKSIITDAVLFVFFSGTLLYFCLGYSTGRRLYWYDMYACAALATLTKGPVGFLLPGLIIVLFLAVQRDFKVVLRCHIVSGLILFLAIAAPWYLAMYNLHGSDFINTFFGTHNFLRATVSEHPRDNVIYYYAAVNILALFPWSGVIPVAIYDKWRRCGKFNLQPREKFLLLWVLVVFGFFQLMATKYITYTYPLLFPAALLIGGYLDKHLEVLKSKIFMGFFTMIYAVLLTAPLWLPEDLVVGQNLFVLPISMIIGVMAAFYLIFYPKGVLYSVSVISITFYLALIYCVAEPLSMQRSAKSMAHCLNVAAADSAAVGLYGNYPTSAVFYSGKKIVKLLPKKDLASFAPRAFSWNSKNVMPAAAIEDDAYKIVVVGVKNIDRFLAITPYAWKQADSTKNWIILKRDYDK